MIKVGTLKLIHAITPYFYEKFAPPGYKVEVIPFESKNDFEVHQILLPMNGTYILENMDTAELAKDKAYEFLFVLGQPRFRGGVQSMIKPIAIR